MSIDDLKPTLTISDEHFDEQFPLAPIDDYMIHQTPDPIRVAWSTDPRIYERFWVICHDHKGELLLVTGLSFYPNLDTAEAYAIVNLRGGHFSVRAFRRLGADRMNMEVGPIKPAIVRGMRAWRYVLEDNEWGISYDLLWQDTHRQVYHSTPGSIAEGLPRGRRADITAGFEGFGVAEGWVKVNGERIELSRDSSGGTRDRHWGVGRGVGGPALQPGRKLHAGWIGGNWVSFKELAIWGNTVLYRFGDARPQMGRIVKTERRLRFESDTQIFLEGVIDYTLDTGEVKTLRYRRLGFQTAYMRCGMYGGTPDKGIHQGQYVGDNVVEGDHYDVTKPEVRRRLMGLDEHHCEITCDGETTTGILQPLEPDAYNACARGRPGWKFLD
ncbi:MAG TPA: hypothetical protein VKT27_00590 [Candidatus Binataceae bacterium]|nr:hypothetical protein [Candidatus Binataceae bacterium]